MAKSRDSARGDTQVATLDALRKAGLAIEGTRN
jgi:hypothetical protein